MADGAATASTNGNRETIRTSVPARLDRLPWAKWHWLVLLGLGTVWILDGLEVTIVGAIGSRLQEGGAPRPSPPQLGQAGPRPRARACPGAALFRHLNRPP